MSIELRVEQSEACDDTVFKLELILGCLTLSIHRKKCLFKTTQRVVSAVSVSPFVRYSCSITQYMHELRSQSSSIPKIA